MHSESYQLMEAMLDIVVGTELDVLDVGSLDVNGSFRPLVELQGWHYTGLDIRTGDNVDVVAPPYEYPFDDGQFDVVISGSTMEHVEAIWEWFPELVRVLKPGGVLALHTHWSFPEHRFPVDCWRIMPDGMAYLLDRAGINKYEIDIANRHDITALAWKATV